MRGRVVCMLKRRILSVSICVFVAMFLAQGAWESPLRPFVWWFTTPGCHIAWLVVPPNYDRNSTVWLFDSVATLINTAVYLAVLWLIRLLYLIGKRQAS